MNANRFCTAAVSIPFLMFLGCRMAGPVIEIGGYSFNHEGKEYRIESVTPNYMEGYNVLSRKDKDELVLKGIDKQQDGILDEIIVGKITIEAANAIYQEGIREGERRNYIKKRSFAREYKTSDQMTEYVLATYILAVGEVYNRLSISQRQSFQPEAVVVDSEADGMLDIIEKGPGTLGGYQKLYRMVLEKGMREKKVVNQNKRYLVVI